MNTPDLAKVLIVDDLPENLLALEALIRQDGREIHQARSGDEALGLLLEHEFALAIVDVQMPGMDGFELAELIRGTERTRHVPIVFVSAAGRELNYAFQGYESGAVDFLYKPLDAHAVKSKVTVFVALHQQRKQLERQLEELEESRRQQEVLVHELRAAQNDLERAVQMRDDFMSMVSHELRTPLNTISLQTQMRKRQLASGNAQAFSLDQVRTMVERDERQTRSMVRLIDDMLDVSRLQRGSLSMQPRPMDLSQVVRRVVDGFSEQAAATGCPITLDAPDAVNGTWDEFRIEQVVANLMTNAFRYGAGKPIEVSVGQEGGHGFVKVRDHGIGIAPENIERIFGQFERAVDSRSIPGLGLGLYITRQILQAHDGSISAQSTPGEGSVFTVRLPLDGPRA
jgi:signal transduction histidine kinase